MLNDGTSGNVIFALGVKLKKPSADGAQLLLCARTRPSETEPDGALAEAAIVIVPLPLLAAGIVIFVVLPPALTVTCCACEELTGTLVDAGAALGAAVAAGPGETLPPPHPAIAAPDRTNNPAKS